MGTFIEQVEKNNRLQVQNLSYKKQVQLQKEEAKRKREKEKEKKQDILYILIGFEKYIDVIFLNNYYKHNKKDFQKLYINLLKNKHNYINDYIKQQAINQLNFTSYELDLLYIKFNNIYEKTNNKYYNNTKKIENIENSKKTIPKKKTVKKHKKQATFTQHATTACLGIATGFFWRSTWKREEKKKRIQILKIKWRFKKWKS